jgi:hypothetical protein
LDTQLSSLKGGANAWLSNESYDVLRHRLEDAHATVETAAVEAGAEWGGVLGHPRREDVAGELRQLVGIKRGRREPGFRLLVQILITLRSIRIIRRIILAPVVRPRLVVFAQLGPAEPFAAVVMASGGYWAVR